ncbi:MAG: hypothetical protein HQ557_08955 [Bacteroidetes bacterium]|nr:hypothetical protein [Bacteroidota bacterium]
MTSEERITITLNHQEPDRIPIDFGGHLITGIHIDAYKHLTEYLRIPKDTLQIERYRQRTAVINELVFERFNADFRPLVPPLPDLKWFENENHTCYKDEWGVTWCKKRDDGLYYEHHQPLYDSMPTIEMIRDTSWPDYSLSKRIVGLHKKVKVVSTLGKVPILDLPLGLEIFDAGFNICGAVNFYMLLALDPQAAAYLMDRQLEAQIDWWTQAIYQIPELTLVRIGDDLGSQDAMLIDPEMYRTLVLPRHKKLFQKIKEVSKNRIKIIMHSDGAIKPIIPDLIEAGIDCLNPIQYSVSGINPVELKKEFGDVLTFWGGGIDTQNIMPNVSPAQVKDEVKRQIDILAPGGGYVFSQVHILQKDIPAENIVAMFDAALEFGGY